jgi:hypothetical protein
MRSPKTTARPVCLWLPRLLSGVGGPVSTSWELLKGCHVRGLPRENVRRTCMDWNGKRTWRVGQISPCRVYIDSNRRDSRI